MRRSVLPRSCLSPCTSNCLVDFVRKNYIPIFYKTENENWRIISDLLAFNDFFIIYRITKLPIIVKGVLIAEDALTAIEHGAVGIMVSNHGGRQLDTAPSSVWVVAKPPILFFNSFVRHKCALYIFRSKPYPKLWKPSMVVWTCT